MSRPTYDQLAELVVQQAEEIARLKAHILRQDARMAELERQLASTSRNSSKPPPTDGLAKPAPKSLRGKSGPKPGGQTGHRGQTLRQVPGPYEVLRHEPACCTRCAAGLAGATEAGVARRQAFDLPPVDICVTEHQLVSRRCGCGAVTRADAPDGVGAPMQYGPWMLAVIMHLYIGQCLSKQRTARALGDLFGTPISHGTVSAATSDVRPIRKRQRPTPHQQLLYSTNLLIQGYE